MALGLQGSHVKIKERGFQVPDCSEVISWLPTFWDWTGASPLPGAGAGRRALLSSRECLIIHAAIQL